jgi:putative DNA primase/helicase
MQPLLNKTLAVINDARLSVRTDLAVVTERLLSISGEDAQTIDRKHQLSVMVRLPVRFMILTNELPQFNESSGALVGRLIVLRQTVSFCGREDTTLTDRLLRELPSILLWAVKGWGRLRERGGFRQPESGKQLVSELDDLASPIGAFLREACVVEPGAEVPIHELFAVWKAWCERKGRKPGNQQTFGRNLRSALPAVDVSQPRIDGKRLRVYAGLRLRRPNEEDAEEDGAP